MASSLAAAAAVYSTPPSLSSHTTNERTQNDQGERGDYGGSKMNFSIMDSRITTAAITFITKRQTNKQGFSFSAHFILGKESRDLDRAQSRRKHKGAVRRTKSSMSALNANEPLDSIRDTIESAADRQTDRRKPPRREIIREIWSGGALCLPAEPSSHIPMRNVGGGHGMFSTY